MYFKIGLAMALTFIISSIIMACGSTPALVSNPPEEEASVEIAVVPPATPTTAPTNTPPPAIMAPDDGCVVCHSDQEMLVATAKEEDVLEELSEGEG